MSVLYLMDVQCALRKSGGRMLVEKAGEKVASVPMKEITSVVVGEAQVTTQAISVLLRQGVPMYYVDRQGRLIGALQAPSAQPAILVDQVRKFSCMAEQLRLTRYILQRKLDSQMDLLRVYAKRRKSEALKCLADSIRVYGKTLATKLSLEELRGVEGMAARVYFQGMADMLDREKWLWQGRNRRPPQDPVNSLLSFGYALLEKEIRLAILGTGLDCRIGFFHANNGRKDGLVFDLMELFRHNVIDRMIIKFFNQGIFKQEDFCYQDEACLLTQDGRKKWFLKYEAFMEHTLPGSNMSYRRFIEVEIGLFVEFLQTDLSASA